MSKTLFSCIILLHLTAVQASAWTANVEGPDIFGVTKAWAASDGSRESLIVQCSTDDQPIVAYLFRKEEFSTVDRAPARLFIKAASAAPIILDAARVNWNDNWFAIAATGESDDLMRAIAEIRDAPSVIQVGMELLGNQFSGEIGAGGSTNALQRVISSCGLNIPTS